MRKSKVLKALLVFGMSVATATSVVGMTACNPEEEHAHTYKSGWSTSAEKHWHDADCGHDVKSDEGVHTAPNADGKCDTCGYQLQEVNKHTHNYSETWEKDANSHWHECTSTTGACLAPVKDLSSHVDENKDNICDECEYKDTAELPAKYTELKNSENNILAETFFVSKEKLDDFAGWGTRGIYSEFNGKGDGTAETNYVKVENGIAEMVDTSSGGTSLVVDYGSVLGVVEGYIEVTLISSGNSWTFLQFNGYSAGKQNAEVFGLRTDSGKIKYRLDGGSVIAGTTTPDMADTTYKIYYKFDLLSGKVTLTINGEDIVSDLQTSISGLTGLKVVSSDSGSKTAKVDNVAVVNTPPSVDEYKTTVTAKVDSLVTLLPSEVDVTEKTTAVKVEINAATTIEGCDTAYKNYELSICEDYKSYIMQYMNVTNYPESNYTKPENSEVFAQAKAAGETAVNGATSVAALKKAFTAWENSVKDIKTDSYYNKADVTITVSDGTNTKTLTVKEGDTVTKEQLDELIKDIIPTANRIEGYYTDAACTTAATLPLTASAAQTIYVKFETFSSELLSADTAEAFAFEGTLIKTELNGISPTVVERPATVDGDASNTFSKAFLPGGGTATNAKSYKITAKDSITLKVYYSVGDSGFTSTDVKTKSGNLKWEINGGAAQESTNTASKANNIAYVEEITLNKDDVLLLYVSANRLCIFAIEAIV